MQTGAPVPQAMAPVWQGLAVSGQAVPAAQATQVPPLQTIPSPQAVPSALAFCVSVQEGPAAAQAFCPS